ncbi:hypothetical protein MM26B8_02080 [Mycoplasmopsis meleagridis]|uniref:Rho termination factor N-terminal domain-containing protein n=1 Tax=Mycoplasmopsis meleagridis TaxID=29561 RepID=UPI0007C28ADA|nr:Rho termination factor N-terminal domain-containing protein [Mycoplasmopsis meleagridis]OAD18423.1 hypothetical protein MM26B8_02080 [Mycoplasmopsis meleagridis]
MKRLLCYYEKKQDATYPWLLKHPKIKSGLAKFKTRQEAIQWYMLLKFETSIWFQNDQKIFGGQLSIDNEDDSWYNYVKVSGFDGGETYEGVCDEFGIDPRTFQYDYATAEKRLKNLDFVLLHDPYTYFPPELEISKKSRKEMLDIDKVNELLAQREKEIKDQHEQELQEKEEEIIDLKNEATENNINKNNSSDIEKEKAKTKREIYFDKIKKLPNNKVFEMAENLYISGYSKMTREELIEAILNATNN